MWRDVLYVFTTASIARNLKTKSNHVLQLDILKSLGA